MNGVGLVFLAAALIHFLIAYINNKFYKNSSGCSYKRTRSMEVAFEYYVKGAALTIAAIISFILNFIDIS